MVAITTPITSRGETHSRGEVATPMFVSLNFKESGAGLESTEGQST